MHVMHVIGAFVAGGAERFVAGLAPELAARGVTTRLFGLSNRSDPAGNLMMAELARAGIAMDRGPTRRVGMRSVYALATALRRVRPQIVHLHTPNTELAVALATRITGSNSLLTRTLHSTQHPHGLIHRWAWHRNQAQISVACSEAVKVSDTGVKGPIEVIENGVNFGWPLQNDAEQRQARQRLGLDPNSRHFVAVGSMSGNTVGAVPKAHDILIRAWRASSAGSRGHLLHLVGDGNLRPELEALAHGDNSIRFRGVQANIGDWLLAADVFVMPSRYEGLPIAAIEAVGTGLPCIFSNIPPLRQLEPPVATWVAVDDTSALSAAIAAVGENPPRVPVAAAAQARARFSIAVTAERYIRLYDRLIGAQ
jgi:glycosyltransferase involved in cell wall biosynthesis